MLSSPSAKNPFVYGDYVYMTFSYSHTMAVVDISNPSSPWVVGSYTSSLFIKAAQGVAVEGRLVLKDTNLNAATSGFNPRFLFFGWKESRSKVNHLATGLREVIHSTPKWGCFLF